jgi:quercetin dioxygenase-like cupin family protein
MEPVRWDDIPSEQLTDTLQRQAVWGEKSTLARFTLAKGTHVSRHKHENEQFTLMLQGSMKMNLAGRDLVMRAGDVLVIPPWKEHEVWVLEDAVVLDFFTPTRQDWKEGQHQYLQGK